MTASTAPDVQKRRVVDVSRLPMLRFGHHDPLWWSILCLIAIEGTMLVLLAISYIYVADRTSPFPPTHMGRDCAYIATLELGLWIASLYPAWRLRDAAIAGSISGMRRWLIAGAVLGVLAVLCRLWLFDHLPFRWDSHAYGSVVWTMLGVQWTHALTGVGEDILFIILLFRGPFEDKHRVDVEVTVPLWFFVVAGAALTWALMFAELLFRGPR